MNYKYLQNILAKSVVASLLISALSFLSAAQQPTVRDFSKENARSSQDWVKDGVIYEIFPRNYSNKGDFNSITADLDRLQTLGVTILWLMPIHPVGHVKSKGTIGSPYAVKDYYAINPDYGTKADLQRLINEAHKRQIKVIIDIVANHTSWDSVMMKNPAFYTHDKAGNIIPPVPDWADVADLNYDNPELRKYMSEMLKSWLRDYDLDGFRCDVAGSVPTDFWENARMELEKIKPNIVMLAEANQPDLLTKAFDLDYSWDFHSALTEVEQGAKPASVLQTVWNENRAKFPKNALRMRFSDNHDERRAIARFGERGALAAQALVFTLDGVPLVYNGMEVGDTTESGAPALFEKMPILWGIAERRPEFPLFYRALIALRKSSPALRRGDLIWLKNSDDRRILSFLRRDGTSGEEVLVAINMSNEPFVGTIEGGVGFEEITPDIAPPLPPDDDKAKAKPKPIAALPVLALDSWGYRIFRRQK